MEIPVLHRLTDFEKASLQNPSTFLSQKIFSSFSSFPNTSVNPYTFCKWSAVILLALIASFTTVFQSLLLRFRSLFSSSSQNPQYDTLFDDSDFSDDTSSVSSLSDDEQDEINDIPESSSYDDFRVKGSDFYLHDQGQNRNLRRRLNGSIGDLFSLSELIDGKNVVKLWDNLGSVVAGYAGDSPALALAAEGNVSGYLLKVWDTRVGSRIPGILAEWKPRLGQIVGVGTGGVEKVYVRDDVTGALTVGDMRMAGSPLMNVTESDVDTWWDADAVIVGDGGERVFDNSD